jgi:hypothetical protein
MDAAGQIQRGYDYGLKHYPKLTQDEHVARVLEHLVMKYGPGGKGRRHYFPETETRLNDMIDPVIQLHKNKDIEGAKKLIKLSAPNLPFSYQRAQGIAQLIKGRLSYPDSLNKWVGNTDTSKLQNIVAALMTTGRGIKNLGNQASVHHGPPQTNPFLGILSSKLRISKMIDDVLVAERNQQPAFFSGGMGRSTLRSSGEPLRSVVYTPPQITHPKVTPGTPLVEVHIPQTEIPEFMSLGKRPMNVLPGLDQGSPMWHRVLNHEEWRPVGEQIAKAVPQMGEIVRGYPNPKEVSELQRLVMNFVRTHRNVGT